MKNKIEDLRNHLFEQLERLRDDEDCDLDKEIRRSETIVEVAKVIVDSARVENEFLKIAQLDKHGMISSENDGIINSKQNKRFIN